MNRRLRKTEMNGSAEPADRGGRGVSHEASATDRIVTAVTRAIVEHRLLPGAKLAEQKLGDHFGVSRTIVRQALFQLSQNKLVTLEPARGAFVAAPSIDEARQVFAVRRMLETQMTREFVERATTANIRALKAHLKAEREAVSGVDVQGRTKLLADFHVRMAQLLDNTVLAEMLSELISRCSLITLMYQSAQAAEESSDEHVAIVKAIEARDADRAVALMHEHLSHVERSLAPQRRAPSADLTEALAA